MIRSPNKPFRFLALSTLILTTFTVAGIGSQKSPLQVSPQSNVPAPDYFPPGRNDAGIFPYVLYNLKEPSLFQAAKNPTAVSFRMSVVGYVTAWMMSIRLDVNPDGSGQITSATSTWHAAVKSESKNVSPLEVKEFLQLVDKVGFWSMTKIEEISELNGRKVYIRDGGAWIVEGVRNGSFHYVYGPNPKSGPIMEIVHYLARDLARLGNSELSIPGYPMDSTHYDKLLGRMNEVQLPNLAKDFNVEVYRLMILPTWGNPIVIKVQRHGDLYALSVRRLDGQAGFDTGNLVESKEIELSADDSKTLAGLVQSLNFFQLSEDDSVVGDDGDDWIIEGVSQGKYHVALRWCAAGYNPDKRGLKPFLTFCKFLVDKSRLSERPKNKGHKLI